jgi:hypothetical protein
VLVEPLTPPGAVVVPAEPLMPPGAVAVPVADVSEPGVVAVPLAPVVPVALPVPVPVPEVPAVPVALPELPVLPPPVCAIAPETASAEVARMVAASFPIRMKCFLLVWREGGHGTRACEPEEIR